MAKGAEIYRKIEHAYASSNWPEVSRLAKKYRRRNDLSEEWEAVLEGMAGIWRALERLENNAGEERSVKDSAERLGMWKIEAHALKETAGLVNQRLKEQKTGLVPAVQAVLLCAAGEYQQAVSLFNTTAIASTISSPVVHLLFSSDTSRANSAKEIPQVECLIALQCVYFKGLALEGIQQTGLAVDQYAAIFEFNAKTQSAETMDGVRRVLLEVLYRRAMLLAKTNKPSSAIAIKQALSMERTLKINYGAVRRLLLGERWLEVFPAVYRRHSLRTTLDSLATDASDLVAENLEEERVWTCEVMIAGLRRLYEPQSRHLYSTNRGLIERLNNVVIKNLALGAAHFLLVDFLKSGVYSRMRVGKQYYTQLFLALLSAPEFTLSEAYMAGDVLVKKYPNELDPSVKTAFLGCCYRLCLYDRVIEECAGMERLLTDQSRILLAKSCIMKARPTSDAGLLMRAKSVLSKCIESNAEVVYAKAACTYEFGDVDKAIDHIQRACSLDPGSSRYQLYHALLLSAKKDYQSCLIRLCNLWAEHPVHSVDLTLAKARCEQALGRPFAAIETLASRISYNIAQAAATAASTTLFSSSDPVERGATVSVIMAQTQVGGAMSAAGSEGDLSRAAGFLSEPAVDILQHKIHNSNSVDDRPAGALATAVGEYERAFPRDPEEFRVERLEHGLHIPEVLDTSCRLAAVEREGYSELALLLELTVVYLNTPGQEEEVEYCMSCIKRLDSLLPHLYYLQGLQFEKSQPGLSGKMYERSVEFGGCTEALLAIASANIKQGNAAYSKMLLNRMRSGDYRVSLLLAQSCMQLGQMEEAGEHFGRAMKLEEYSMLYTPAAL